MDWWTRLRAETWLMRCWAAKGEFGRAMNARGETRSMLPTKRRDEADVAIFARLAAFIIVIGCWSSLFVGLSVISRLLCVMASR